MRLVVVALALAVLAMLAVLAPPPLASGQAGDPLAGARIRAASGNTQAGLFYEGAAGESNGVELRIVRSGTVSYSAPISLEGYCENPPCTTGLTAKPLTVADLDTSGEPEVLVDAYTGGAHCCTVSQVFSFRSGAYRITQRDWRDAGYRLIRPADGSAATFDSLDADFAYAYSAYASSVLPKLVMRFRGGKFADVSRNSPRTRRHAAQTRREYEATVRRSPRHDARPRLAALAADLRNLGRRATADRLLREALAAGRLRKRSKRDPYKADAAFIRDLNRFLRRLGYPS